MAVTARMRALTSKRMRVDMAGARNAAVGLANSVGAETVGIISKYPPPKVPSSYIRTNRLGSGWRYTVTSPASGIVLKIRNATYYTSRVHGDERGEGQWAMHLATGWPQFAPLLQVMRAKWVSGLSEIYSKHPPIVWR